MKTIIAGSRNVVCYDSVLGIVADSGFIVTEIVCGMARGVDIIGKEIGYNFDIPVKPFEPDWDKYPRLAGFIRNKEMAEYADALIAVWDGHSGGTRNMIDTAKRLGLLVYIGMV